MPWRPPTASGPRQRTSTARSAPCAATLLRQIRMLTGHGAPSPPDLSSLAPKLLPPLLLRLPPSPPLPPFDPRDGKLAGAGGAGSSPRGLGSRCAAAGLDAAEEQRSSPLQRAGQSSGGASRKGSADGCGRHSDGGAASSAREGTTATA